jgi:hypothetical protein
VATESIPQPGLGPRLLRRGAVVRALVVTAAVAQLVAAIVLALHQGTSPDPVRRVATLAPASVVGATVATTSTTMPPVVVEVPAAVPAAAPATTAVPTGAVYGVIGAGAGGRARADLRDEAGNTWHSEANTVGAYRFDRLPPGRYQLVLSAESGGTPCTPDGTCIGTAMAMSKRVIELAPGQEIREDYPAYGPTTPAPPVPATTTTVPDATTTSTSTTSL